MPSLYQVQHQQLSTTRGRHSLHPPGSQGPGHSRIWEPNRQNSTQGRGWGMVVVPHHPFLPTSVYQSLMAQSRGTRFPGRSPHAQPYPHSTQAPEGDEACEEQREGQHTQDDLPHPVVHAQLAPPHFSQEGLWTGQPQDGRHQQIRHTPCPRGCPPHTYKHPEAQVASPSQALSSATEPGLQAGRAVCSHHGVCGRDFRLPQSS